MKAALALVTVALAGCVTTPTADAGPSARIGEIAYTNGLRVKPVAVIEDSRCPALVRCVWAGRLVVRAEVIGGSWRQSRDLELGKPQQIADGALTLVRAEPQKATPGEIARGVYRFTRDRRLS